MPVRAGASIEGLATPVGTPPNAIVYGLGRLRVTRMVSAGLWMNLAASGIVSSGVLLM